jgi:hypothetical protein
MQAERHTRRGGGVPEAIGAATSFRILIGELARSAVGSCATPSGSDLPSCANVRRHYNPDNSLCAERLGSRVWIKRRLIYTSRFGSVVRAIAAGPAEGEWQAGRLPTPLLVENGLRKTTIATGLADQSPYDVNFDARGFDEPHFTTARLERRTAEVYLQVLGSALGNSVLEQTLTMAALKYGGAPDTHWAICSMCLWGSQIPRAGHHQLVTIHTTMQNARTHFFISYRRDDIASKTIVRFLAREIDTQFGRDAAFYDLEGISPSENWKDKLDQKLATCAAVIVLIGDLKKWLGSKEGDKGKHQDKRIEDPEDWVRGEIEAGFKSGKKILPILIDGAEMPTYKHLPPSIATLSNLQATTISTDRRFDSDIKVLLDDLQRIESHFEGEPFFKEKSLNESLRQLWSSNKDRYNKIRATQRLCRGLSIPELVYESFSLKIDIKDPAGNADFIWRFKGFNATDRIVEGEAKSLWFENPQTRPIEISTFSEEGNCPTIEILRDYANYKDFFCHFAPVVQPYSEFQYGYCYRAPRMFTENHYWDWKSRNLTLKADIEISHRKNKRFKACSVERQMARGIKKANVGALKIGSDDNRVHIRWSQEMPKLDAIYRIFWDFIDD